MDKPVATDPAAPEPTPDEARSWLRENLVNIVLGVGCLVVVLRYLDPLSVVMAAAGLTFIIFIHELGHFAAAKLCNVRVEAFSIGFGPPLPFCAYKYGETTYKLCAIPLGGFVKMLGEGDGTNDDTADHDPRSFKNQSVPERMLIISAGVIMNIILACVLFVIVYMHGLEEMPATVAQMEAGGTAWRQNIHTGTEIRKIGSQDNPWFDDIRPKVWATSKGELLDLRLEYNGAVREVKAEPIKDEGAPFPMLGIAPMETLTLAHGARTSGPPFAVDSPASQAKDADGNPLLRPGDTLIGMSDPDQPGHAVTPIKAAAGDARGDVFVYYRRLARLAGEPVTLEVRRQGQSEGETVPIMVPPGYRRDSGLRMRMGSIVATRVGSPADAAKVQPKDGTNPGDRIVEVEFANADKTVTVLTSGKTDGGTAARVVKPLDPVKLPHELNRWADRTPGDKTVKLTLLREQADDHSEKRITLELPWDAEGRFDLTGAMKATTPLAINGLGLAYHVQAVVDHVTPNSLGAANGFQPNDTIEAVKWKILDGKGVVDDGRWETVKPHQWAFVDDILQRVAPFEAVVRVNRGGQTVELPLTTAEDRDCPLPDRGLILMPELRIQKANSIGEALQMGANRTLRMVQSTYINLYAMLVGRVSAIQTMSGPITLARISYILAGESVWKLLLMLALININLAVVNFLPIPLLDGGHMMFLIYEGFRGKPPPERVHILLTYLGFFLVVCLMLFTIGLDIYRLLKMWLRW